MPNIKDILDGWENFVNQKEVSEKMARQRAEYCKNCINLKKGGLLSFVNDDIKEIQGFYCNLCKCPLSAKLRSKNSNCPINKF